MQEKLGLRVTQASLNQTALDWPRNMANIYSAINKAVSEKSDILAFDELTITGYEANDEFQRTDNTRILESLDDIAAYANALDPNLIISIGHPWRLQMRDIPAIEGQESGRIKEPLYDRLNLPFNVQTIISGGAIHGMSAKTNLYNDERGYEKRYFNEWDMVAANRIGGRFGTILIPLDDTGRIIPFGNPVFHVSDGNSSINIAQAICETKWVATKYDGYPHNDSRYEEGNVIPSISRYLGGSEGLVIIIPNASPPARDKIDKHVHLNSLASKYADVVIDTDGLGSSGSTFAQFGHRMVVQKGEVISYGRRMDFARVALTTSAISLTAAIDDTASKSHAILTHIFNNQTDKSDGTLSYRDDPQHLWDSPQNPNRHFEEVIRYTAFWLFDYMRKAAGSRGIMEALSGGADSAFNSVIVAVMVRMGITELGLEKFCEELNIRHKETLLSIERENGTESATRVCIDEMLTAVYMGTNNSSEQTRNAAEFLVKGGIDPNTGDYVQGIGGKFVNRNVQDLLDFYGVMYAVENTSNLDPLEKQQMMRDIAIYLNVSPHTTTPEERAAMAAELKSKYPQIVDLVTAADGVAYENIQARGREVLIMLFANKEGKMAVANPNLDEARNAYATFGGDLHSGTINLNAHLSKAYQLQIMHYLYENGVQGVMPPVRSLAYILKNKPSAELLPKGSDGTVVQNDEDSLQRSFAQMNAISEFMLYERIHTSNGDRRLNAQEVFVFCQNHPAFVEVDDNQLYNMVRMSYNRWTIAQHKIHASPIAPTFGRNVDHQTSQRTPNIHGQSKDELALLGIDLIFKWAQEDGLAWDATERRLLERRAWQDERFIKIFDRAVRTDNESMTYNLRSVYEIIKRDGWNALFPVLNDNHPIRVIGRRGLEVK